MFHINKLKEIGEVENESLEDEEQEESEDCECPGEVECLTLSQRDWDNKVEEVHVAGVSEVLERVVQMRPVQDFVRQRGQVGSPHAEA